MQRLLDYKLIRVSYSDREGGKNTHCPEMAKVKGSLHSPTHIATNPAPCDMIGQCFANSCALIGYKTVQSADSL